MIREYLSRLMMAIKKLQHDLNISQSRYCYWRFVHYVRCHISYPVTNPPLIPSSNLQKRLAIPILCIKPRTMCKIRVGNKQGYGLKSGINDVSSTVSYK